MDIIKRHFGQLTGPPEASSVTSALVAGTTCLTLAASPIASANFRARTPVPPPFEGLGAHIPDE